VTYPKDMRASNFLAALPITWISVAGLAALAASTPAPGLAPALEQNGIETIYVIEFSHADVGFDAPPTVMEQRNHDRTVAALDLMDARTDYKWTIETTYQMEGFLERASGADKARLKQRLDEGRLDFGANYTNLHSGNCGEEQVHRLAYEAKRYGELLQHAPTAAFLDDVPGFTQAMPRVLAASGVPYAVLGPNSSFGGKPDIPLQDRPFWWQGRDGSRTLTWMSYGSYPEGYLDWGLTSLANANAKVPVMIAEYENAGYPYDAVMVLRAFDDTYPNNGMAILAQQWNNSHTSPKIKLATAAEFFEHLQTTYGDVYPTYSGDASGNWEDVTAVTPASTAMVRHARSSLPQLEALCMQSKIEVGRPYPKKELRRAWKQSLVFDEHSGGGVGWPGLLTAAEVNQENQDFVDIATGCRDTTQQQTTAALQAIAPQLVPTGEGGLVVFNPLGKARTAIYEIDCGSPQPADLRLIDPAGGPDPIFRWMDVTRSTLAIEVDLPAYGWRRFQIGSGGTTSAPPTWSTGNTISSSTFQLTLDPATGVASSLANIQTGFEWMDSSSPHDFFGIEAGMHLEVFFSQYDITNPQPISIEVESAAPLFRRARVSFGGDLIREYTLHENGKRLDLTAWMDDAKLPHVAFDDHSRHYGLTFPANLTAPTLLTIDGPDGFYQPGRESLPNATLSHFGTGTGGILHGSNGRWLAVTSLHAPTLDLGEMTGAPATSIESDETAITYKLTRHHDQGKVKGGAIVDFDIEPGLPDVTEFGFVARFGQPADATPTRAELQHDMADQLYAWVDQGTRSGSMPATRSYLNLSGSADVIAIKQSESGNKIVIRIRAGINGASAQLQLPTSVAQIWRANLVEQPQALIASNVNQLALGLSANEVITLLILP
jgi:hypothetical protein